MSEIKNVLKTWIALNSSKCDYLKPLRFKGLKTVETDLKFRHSLTQLKNIPESGDIQRRSHATQTDRHTYLEDTLCLSVCLSV